MRTEDQRRSSNFEDRGTPNCGSAPGACQNPTLAVFANRPGFYSVMERRVSAPGGFAQAYVIAHEVGHRVQNLIGSSTLKARGETSNQNSVRVEPQADCLAGVWGHTSRAPLRKSRNVSTAIG